MLVCRVFGLEPHLRLFLHCRHLRENQPLLLREFGRYVLDAAFSNKMRCVDDARQSKLRVAVLSALNISICRSHVDYIVL